MSCYGAASQAKPSQWVQTSSQGFLSCWGRAAAVSVPAMHCSVHVWLPTQRLFLDIEPSGHLECNFGFSDRAPPRIVFMPYTPSTPSLPSTNPLKQLLITYSIQDSLYLSDLYIYTASLFTEMPVFLPMAISRLTASVWTYIHTTLYIYDMFLYFKFIFSV